MDAIIPKPYTHNLGGNTAAYESKGGRGRARKTRRNAKQHNKTRKTYSRRRRLRR